MRLSSFIKATSLCHLAVCNAAFTWKNVHIGGGGGFIPGIVFNQGQKGVAYARADIGGIYKLNADDSWTAITDNIAQDASWHNLGIDALALDPQNANSIYAAVGMYTNSWDPNNGAIIRSLDGGSTWASSNLTFKVGGNMPGRGMGERLAVDPHNSKIIYFGARSGNGLWKSTDGGVTFSKVSSFTAVGTYVANATDTTGYQSDIQGLAFITFDSTSALVNGATSRIFVGTAVKGGNSVYVSNDAGATWTAVAGQPTANLPHKCKLQPSEKALYLTYSNTSGPYDGGTGSVNRYDITTGTWKDITPVNGTNLYFGFGGLGVDMQKPGTLVVASLNSWWPDAQLFRSTDSGNTWSPIWEWTSYPSQNLYYSWNTNKAPWIANSMDQTPGDFTLQLGWMIESLEIDPFDSDHWLYGTGETIYGGHDLTKWDTVHNVTIQSLADGIEEFAVQDLKSIPGGTELLVAVGDDGGFTFPSVASLSTSPSIEWEDPEVSTNTGVDYAGNKPSNIVRCGSGTDGTPQVGVSTDGGKTWNIDYGTSGANYGGKIAYSADGDTVLWSSSQGVLVSQYTNAFKAVSGIPSGAAIASDKRNGTVLYAGGVSDGSFYVSVNTGQAFTKTTSLSGATAVHAIVANPTTAGDIWVSTDSGLFHSTNYGSSFTKPSTTLSSVYGIALGKGTGSYWNVYAFANGPSGAGLYGSGDSGVSWTYIQGAIGFGSISGCALAASPNQANLVYVGGNGRGVFQGTGALSGSTAPPTSTASSATSTTLKSTSTTSSSLTTSTKTTSTHTTTLVTQTSTTTTPVGTGAPVPKYGQCGGQGYTGSTVCASGSTCQVQNPYYSQCL